MADESLRIGDGEIRIRVTSAGHPPLSGHLTELSPQGATFRVRPAPTSLESDGVVDCQVEVRKAQLVRQLAATVGKIEGEDVHLTWIATDPGQPAKVKALIDAWSAAHRGHGSKAGQKPATPAAKPPPPPPTGAPAAVPTTASFAKPSSTGTQVFQPFGEGFFTPFGAEAPKPTAPATGATEERQPVVIAPTARFEKATSTEAEPTAAPATVGESAPDYTPPAQAGTGTVRRHRTPAPTAPGQTRPKGALVSPSGQLPGPTFLPAEEPKATPSDWEDIEHGGGSAIKGQDGKVDISASLRQRSRTVRASELAARHDQVRVLNLTTIRALIQEAVEETASTLTRNLDEAERARLMSEAEEAFQERMKAFQSEKASAEEQSRKLADQLTKAQQLLDQERSRSIAADQFTVSTAGLEQIEEVFRRLVDRAASEGRLLPELEEQLKKAASNVLDSERERIRAKEMEAHGEKIELLEKKIRRLAGNLEEVEKQRDEAREIAQHLEKFAGQGLSMDQIKQKYQIGLKKDDPNRERKLEVMREILEQNRDLRRKLGIAINEAAPEPAKEAEPAPEPVAAEAAAESTPDVASPVTEGDAVVPEVNPDDEPWGAEETPAGNPDDEAWSAQTPSVNPDDEPWEPGKVSARTEPVDEVPDGVKRITAFKTFAPPPRNA